MVGSSRRDKIIDIIIIIIMILAGIFTIYPFLNVLALSFNDAYDSCKGGIHVLPRIFTLANYEQVFKMNTLTNAFIMSFLRTVVGTFTSVICTMALAYVVSRKDFIARKQVTLIFLVTMYIGGGMIPDYMLTKSLGLMENFAVYIIPGIVGTWNVIVMRSFIDNLPESFQESARIDGANDLVILFRIIVPLCIPVIATVSLFNAVGNWNDWFTTYLYCGSSQWLSTLSYELMKVLTNASQLMGGTVDVHDLAMQHSQVTPESVRMAITIIATVPILCVYPFIQKYFVTGMTLGGVKE